MFLQKFENGVLTRANTILTEDNSVQIVKIKDGKFDGVLKEKKLQHSGDSGIREEIYENLFPLRADIVSRICEVSRANIVEGESQVANMIGSFVVGDGGLFFGTLSEKIPEGLGIYLSPSGKIKVGTISGGQFEGPLRIVDKGGIIMDGMFKDGTFVERSKKK